MRLRLNTKLRAALIAAVSAVGFTTFSTGTVAVATGTALLASQQAWASVIQASDTLATKKALADAEGSAITLSGMSYANSASNTNQKSISDDVFSPDIKINGADGWWTLTFTLTNSTEKAITLDSLTLDMTMYNASGGNQNPPTYRSTQLTLTQDSTVLYTDNIVLSSVTDSRLNGSYLYNLAEQKVTDQKPTLTLGQGGITLDAGTSQTFTLKAERSTIREGATNIDGGCFFGLKDMVVNYSYEGVVSTWNGSAGHTNWTDADAWSGGVPAASSPIIFDNTASVKSVVVNEAVTAGSITVSDEYTFELQNALTTSNLTISDGGSLALTGTGTVNASSISASGKTINIGENVVLKGEGSATLDGLGTYALASGDKIKPSGISLADSWKGTVAITNAAFVNDLTNINSMGNANSWVLLKGTSGWSANNTFNANLILENDGTDGWAFAQNDGNNGHTLNFTGKIKGAGKLGRSNDKGSTYTYAFSGDIREWTGTFESRSKTDHSTTFRVSDNATAVNAALVNASGNLNVDVQTSATFGASVNATQLTVAEGKTATFNGATTFANGLIMEEGASVTVGATGSLNLGGAVTFGHQPIDVLTGGSVTLNADTIIFDLDGLTAADSGSKYTYTLFTAGVNLAEQGITVGNIAMSSKAGKVWEIGTDGTISYTTASVQAWTAQSAANWNYEDENWEGGKFVSGAGALFNLDESMATVNVAVEASSIEVASGSTVTLNVSGAGSLSSGSVVIDDGATMISNLSINSVEEFSVGSGATWNIFANQSLGKGTNNGTIYLGAEGTARLTDASNSKDLLLGITGSGNISLATDVSIAGGTQAAPTTSKATGKLIVEEGKKLTIGSGKGTYVNLTSFSGIELGKNANLETNVATTALRNLTVGEGSHTIHLSDTADYNKVALDLQGTTTLNGDLKLTSGWKYNVNIAALVGTGGLELTGGSESHKVVIGDAAIKTINVGDNMTEVQLNGTVSLTDNLTLKRGTTKVTGTTNVGGELDLSKGGESNATLTITEGATVNVASTFWGHSGSHLNIEKGGALNLNSDKLGLVGLEGGGSITSPSNKDYSTGNADFTLSGVDITAKDNVTIGNKLENSSISTGAFDVSLTNTANVITGATVGEGGSLSMTEGTLFSVIESGGSVTLTGTTLDKESFIEQGGETGSHYDLNGQLTDGDNYYLGTSEKYLTVVNGGTSATGSGLTWGEKQNLTMTDGKIVTEAGQVAYETFYVNDDSVNVSAITNTGTTGVQVAGGTLVVDKETSLNITVTDEGTISGDKADAKQVKIAEGATAYYIGGVEDSGVKFTPSELLDGAVEVDNYGQTQKYSIASRDLSVAAAALEMTGTEDVTVSNYVVVDKLVNTTDKVLTLDNVDALVLTDMSITNSTVEVYTNLAKDTEATVAIAGILQGGGATLKADLTLYGGSTLDVDGGHVAGGTMNALTLGSTLTFDLEQGGLVNLDQDTIDALAGLNEGERLDLIVAADQTKLKYGDSYEGVSYDTLFSTTGLTGPYTVYANEGSFGLLRGSQVPEPTTGTLSLLALAALAARRRRK